MLEPFQNIWDGHSGTINTATHRIVMTSPYIKPIDSAPYGAAPKLRESEKEEMERMLELGVIEPGQIEWASPVVFVPRKNETINFA